MLRSPDNKYEVAWVPKNQLGAALDEFKEFIYKGMENDDRLTIRDLVIKLFNSEVRMGVIYKIDPFEPVGVWFSDLRVDNETNKRFVTIFGLSGINPNKWAWGVWELVASWAKIEECYSGRCQGRLGWLRYVPGVKLLRAINKREGLLEKVL